jgi:hypothetical protein
MAYRLRLHRAAPPPPAFGSRVPRLNGNARRKGIVSFERYRKDNLTVKKIPISILVLARGLGMFAFARTLVATLAAASLCGSVCRYSPAHAANISAPGLHAEAVKANDKVSSYWPTDPVKCDLVLDGDIVEGDSTSLKREFEHIRGTWNSFSFFLCLRSEGGSVEEALKIAEFVLKTQRPSIATVVEEGQTCASACAFVFLAGNAPAMKGAWPQRFLHPSGRLLFHSSRLDLNKFSDDQLLGYLVSAASDGLLKKKIADLYTSGLRDVQSVISTYQKEIYQLEDLSGRWVPSSLFLEMFSQDPDEWVCVDNVDAVGRWNIQVFGYSAPKTPTSQEYLNVCHSAYHWRLDKFAADDDSGENDSSDIQINKTLSSVKRNSKLSPKFDVRYKLEYQAPSAPLTCLIDVKYGDSGVLDEQAVLGVSFVGGTALVSKLAPTSYFKPDKLLMDLAKRSPAKSQIGSKREFTSYPNSQMNGCSLKSIPNLAEQDCNAACSVDSRCVAYSHNKLTSTCELKHTLTARRSNPTWTSGAPYGALSNQSSRRIRMKSATIAEGHRLKGALIDSVTIEDDRGDQGEICASSCLVVSDCVAVELESSTNGCNKFSSVDGLTKGSGNQSVDTYIKLQQ